MGPIGDRGVHTPLWVDIASLSTSSCFAEPVSMWDQCFQTFLFVTEPSTN